MGLFFAKWNEEKTRRSKKNRAMLQIPSTHKYFRQRRNHIYQEKCAQLNSLRQAQRKHNERGRKRKMQRGTWKLALKLRGLWQTHAMAFTFHCFVLTIWIPKALIQSVRKEMAALLLNQKMSKQIKMLPLYKQRNHLTALLSSNWRLRFSNINVPCNFLIQLHSFLEVTLQLYRRNEFSCVMRLS